MGDDAERSAIMVVASRALAQRAPGWLRVLGNGLLDLLFPPRCPGCGRVGALFCHDCQTQVELIPPTVCGRCGRPVTEAGLCTACRGHPSSLDGIVSAAIFGGPLRAAIHSLKYGNNRALAAALAGYMATAWRQRAYTADCIVPVPLHASREAERGYNQAALLARAIGPVLGLPVNEKLVVRHRATRQQALLSAAERHANVSGAFACRKTAAGLRIVLVDDVCTTGSTLEACATALAAAGAASIWALTLARARWLPGQPAPDAP